MAAGDSFRNTTPRDNQVPFPEAFLETLGMHMEQLREKGATYLFESSWKKKYSDRGVRRMLERYGSGGAARF